MSSLPSLIALLLFTIGFAHAGVDGDGNTANIIRKFDFSITLAQLNPDCNISFTGPVINGQFPGPEIHVVKNDIVQLNIKNDPAHNFSSSIHIHGIRQYSTNRADGVAGITQLAIGPGETFVQQFQVLNQSGTFYYHAHVGVQDDTIQGPFIVHESQDAMDNHAKNEIILQWAEWWHQSFHDRFDYYMSPRFIGDGGPDSILLNGKSIWANTSIIPASSDCKGFTYFDVQPNKTYLVRNIGALTFRTLGIAVQDHNMTLVEIDGEPVQPHIIDYLELSAGQRMSFSLTTGNHAAGTVFPIITNYRYRGNGFGYTPNGYGFIRYVDPKTTNKQEFVSFSTTPLVKDLPSNVFPLVDTPGWITSQLKPAASYNEDFILSEPASRTIKLALQEVILPDNTTRFINNNRTYVSQPWGNATMSLIDKALAEPNVGALDATDRFSVAHQTYPLKLGEIIDLVFQNVKLPSGNCVIHPWHTHGHSHYLLAEGPGDYNHEIDKDIQTYPTPLYRDVSMVYPQVVNGTNNCGWTKVRLYTDNPGVWPVHCHITAHMLQGKMIVLEVSPEQLGDYYVGDGSKQDEVKSETKMEAADESKEQVNDETEEHVKDEHEEKDIDYGYDEEAFYDDYGDNKDVKTQISEEEIKENIDEQVEVKSD